MRKTILSLAIVLGLLLPVVPTALAGHDGAPVSVHKTYELGPTFAAWTCPIGGVSGGALSCDPTGQTADDSIDIGGRVFLPSEVPEGVDSVQASVVDDVWGAGVTAANVCTDENANNICGETDEGEVSEDFCGNSPVVDIPAAPNWDSVTVFVSYIRWQVENCDPTAAPTQSTSGGVLNPSGGIFATFG